MKSLCVIPAREGSKTIPQKNIRIVAGKPLVTYTIEAILKSNAFDRVILSTDSEMIVDVVRRYNREIEVPFLRNAELASDAVSLVEVSKDAMKFFDEIGERYDIIFSVQPTNPFTTTETLVQAKEVMNQERCDSVVTVTKIQHYHPFRAYRLERESEVLVPLTEYTTEKFLQKQDRPDAYGFTGALYGRKRKLLEYWNGRDFGLGKVAIGIKVSQEEGFEIDTPFDMEIFESLMQNRKGWVRGSS